VSFTNGFLDPEPRDVARAARHIVNQAILRTGVFPHFPHMYWVTMRRKILDASAAGLAARAERGMIRNRDFLTWSVDCRPRPRRYGDAGA
jgi:hypothetical protein